MGLHRMVRPRPQQALGVAGHWQAGKSILRGYILMVRLYCYALPLMHHLGQHRRRNMIALRPLSACSPLALLPPHGRYSIGWLSADWPADGALGVSAAAVPCLQPTNSCHKSCPLRQTPDLVGACRSAS